MNKPDVKQPLPLKYLRGLVTKLTSNAPNTKPLLNFVKKKLVSWKEFMTSSTTPLLTKAIKVVDLNKVRDNKAGRIKASGFDTPWVKIPNVSMFSLTLRELDPLFALFGIKKRYAPTLHMQEYKSTRCNRYLEHQVLRLDRHRHNPRLYWAISLILMKRSNVFRVVAIQHVFRKWYRNYPLSFIINMNRQLSKLINQGITHMDYHRVYIEKGEKGYRPLGVPKPEWRLYLHMYSNFLTFYLAPHLKGQHGFLPGKGTLTAWQEIFQHNYLQKSYIREWDFKNFFNEIHNNRITEILLKLGVPKEVVYFLENVNRSDIKLPKKEDRKLNEEVFEEQRLSHIEIRNGVLNAASKRFSGFREFIVGTPEQHDAFHENWGGDFTTVSVTEPLLEAYQRNQELMLLHLMREDGAQDIQEYLQLQWALLDEHRPAKIPTDFNGVAQGAPTSPILANTIMNEWIKSHNHLQTCVAYADDSVSFSNQPINLSAPEDTGITINPEKSGYVKYAGKWLKPLKFLGLEFDGRIFRAHTRKGSFLPLGDEQKQLIEMFDMIQRDQTFSTAEEVLDYLEEKVEKRSHTGSYSDFLQGNSWESYFKSRLIGFIQSRLYQGQWNLENLEQDFELKFIKGSWMDTKLLKTDVNIFTASSFACYSLLNIFQWNQKKGLQNLIKKKQADVAKANNK